MVLLKNEQQVLPLAPDTTLNCFGAAQYIFRNSATGAGLIHPRWQASFHQAVAEHSRFSVNDLGTDFLHHLFREIGFLEEFVDCTIESRFVGKAFPSAVEVRNLCVGHIVGAVFDSVAKAVSRPSGVATELVFLAIDLCGKILNISLLDHSVWGFVVSTVVYANVVPN